MNSTPENSCYCKVLSFKILVCLISFLCTVPLHSQCENTQKISDTQGNLLGMFANHNNFGRAVANLGDFDGDGIADLIVSSKDAAGSGSGGLYLLLLNPNGTVKSEQQITASQGGLPFIPDLMNLFATSITAIGDLDDNGVMDIAAGAHIHEDGGTRKGIIDILLLNADGTVKSHQRISDAQGGLNATLEDDDYFGISIANLGDLDFDGVNDIAIGANLDDDGGTNRGAVHILCLNPDGTVKTEQKISDTQGGLPYQLADEDQFGSSVSALGDVDGDGILDMAVGAEWDANNSRKGEIYILFLNTDGSVKDAQKITEGQGGLTAIIDSSDHFGTALADLGDLDGDGIPDLMVGAYGDDDGGNAKGAVYVLLLNSDGSVKAEQKISETEGGLVADLNIGSLFGTSIANLGDLDGDGKYNIAVGAKLDDDGGNGRGAVYLFEMRITDENEITVCSEIPSINNQIEEDISSCLGGNIPTINNVAFDLYSTNGSSNFDGAEIGVFQWQISYDGNTWEDIPNALSLNMNASIAFTGEDTYFRRVYVYPCTGEISYSNEILITQSGIAPEVSILPMHYCPSDGATAVIETNVTGGTPPYSYEWLSPIALSASDIANPTVNFGFQDIYTLIVTDADGCTAKADAIMIPIQADAGSAITYICESGNVELGGPPITSPDPIAYTWSPSTGLSCSDCPNPIASPANTTTYTLSIEDANGCSNSDEITVDVNNYKADVGEDIYVCRGTDVSIGTAAVPNIFYGWAPGAFIDSQTIAQPTFFSGVIPNPNPFEYTLTAFDTYNEDCYSVDTLLAHVVWADAGADDTICAYEPVQIGTPDCCNGQATYKWTVISGDETNSFYDPTTGTFSDTSNKPQPYVFPQNCGYAHYQVEVSWGPNADNSGGAICTDDRVVEHCCVSGDVCTVVDANFINEVDCKLGTIGTLFDIPLSNEFWTFSWSPTTNLSCSDCPNPELIEAVTEDITYTFNYYSKIDSTLDCYMEIDVYDSATGTPQPIAQGGVVCNGNGVPLGNEPVIGWVYEWSPSTGLDDTSSSNPIATPESSTEYTLVVYDEMTQCRSDTVKVLVTVLELPGVTGGDFSTCEGETVTLGTPGNPNYTYAWSPETGLDNPNIAQPTVTISEPISYTLTVTSSNGCIYQEDVEILILSNYNIVTEDITICEGESSILSASVSDVVNEELIYSWSPTTGLSDPNSATTLVSELSATTTYTVTVTSSSGNCSTSSEVSVNFAPLPQLELDELNKCSDSVSLGTNPQTDFIYSWMPIDGLSNPNGANPNAFPSTNTTYTLSIVDDNGCFNHFEQNVNVLSPPIDAGNDVVICEGESINIGGLASEEGVDYIWSPSTGLSNPNSAQTMVQAEETTTYTLSAVGADGCISIDTVRITVIPKADIPPLLSYIVLCADECQNIGISNNNNYTYQWLPADAVDDPTASQTSICPSDDVSLSLIITDPETGCSQIQTMEVFVITEGSCRPALPIYDLSLQKSVDNSIANIDSDVTFTLTIYNEGDEVATAIEVTDVLPSAFTYVSDDSNGAYDNGTGIWSIDSLAVGDSTSIDITTTATEFGVFTNTAEISNMNEPDADSTPNNNEPLEDDIDNVCVSIPIEICNTTPIDVNIIAPPNYTNYQWYNNGVLINGESSQTFNATAPGVYTYTVDGVDPGDCSGELCCPVVIEQVACCPNNQCIPINVSITPNN